MPKLQLRDILSELIDLYRGVIQDIRLQLNYYRVSVYKDEAADVVKEKIEQLHFISKLVSIDSLIEPFADFYATLGSGNCYTPPGECVFSIRVATFLKAIELQLSDLENRMNMNNMAPDLEQSITKQCQKHRQLILSMCAQGTHHRTFFERM